MRKNTDISTIAADNSKDQAARLNALAEALEVIPEVICPVQSAIDQNIFTAFLSNNRAECFIVLTEDEAKKRFFEDFHRVPAEAFIIACGMQSKDSHAAEELENSLISLRYHSRAAAGPFMRAVAEKCGAMEKLWNDPEVRAAVISTGADDKEYTANGFYIYSW